jgi:8-oxo-dGTP pyrophosphatase MutT (NUDIX family)
MDGGRMSAARGRRRDDLLGDAGELVAFLRVRLAELEMAEPSPADAHLREAGVLAPLFALGGRPHLLFTVRAADLRRHRGEISFPGGSRDPDDLSTEQTALREAEEELGLSRSGVTLLGALPAVFAGGSNFLILPYVGWLGEGRPQLTPNPQEVAEVFDAPLAALADPAIYHSELWCHGGEAHTVHFYDFGAYRIWGATGHILRTLLDLLPDD